MLLPQVFVSGVGTGDNSSLLPWLHYFYFCPYLQCAADAIYFLHWKCLGSGGSSPELYQRKLEYEIEGGVRMTAELVIGLVTCVATVINTVFVALSYLKGKDKE